MMGMSLHPNKVMTKPKTWKPHLPKARNRKRAKAMMTNAAMAAAAVDAVVDATAAGVTVTAVTNPLLMRPRAMPLKTETVLSKKTCQKMTSATAFQRNRWMIQPVTVVTMKKAREKADAMADNVDVVAVDVVATTINVAVAAVVNVVRADNVKQPLAVMPRRCFVKAHHLEPTMFCTRKPLSML
jgi:hypothetical protein